MLMLCSLIIMKENENFFVCPKIDFKLPNAWSMCISPCFFLSQNREHYFLIKAWVFSRIDILIYVSCFCDHKNFANWYLFLSLSISYKWLTFRYRRQTTYSKICFIHLFFFLFEFPFAKTKWIILNANSWCWLANWRTKNNRWAVHEQRIEGRTKPKKKNISKYTNRMKNKT